MYKLHSFAQSGNCYKVTLLLQALGVKWENVHMPFADFAKGVPKSDAWRGAENPMGELPILETGSERLTQSGAILIWLAEKHGAYGGRNEAERFEVLRWILFDNHKFTSYLATWRFLKSFMPTAPDPGVEKFLKGRIDNAFGIAEKHLQQHDYVVGSQPTIADLSMCGYLYYPADESGYDIAKQYPAMARWLERLKALPGWKPPYAMMPGERIAPRW
ncbi:MAG TPA: glutathione S-transferase family protein [Steroidobacteraceae bacterium]|nr:glutathione S-transferase family protein [Steroidobacteraceae bacterium]